jgi:succinate dehydrogenase/fumarate reductase flavoprotein subunit
VVEQVVVKGGEAPSDPSRWDAQADIVIVGSGAGGMTAALAAKSAGLEPLVLEKSEIFGGSTAMSGGGIWAPNAPALRRLGQVDDPERVLAYLVAIAGDRVAHDRLSAYVRAAPEMLEFLERESRHFRDAFVWTRGYSDYYPDKGGNPLGRGVWAKSIDRRKLGDDARHLPEGRTRIPGLPKGMWITSADLHSINMIGWRTNGLRPYRTLLALALRVVRYRLLGERTAANGAALVVRLLLALRENGIVIWRNTPMLDLVTDRDRVVGVRASRAGETVAIHARHGVVLASGGFEHNPEMRERYQPIVKAGWSVASRENTGDGITAGQAVGAALDLMDDAWWYPVIALPSGLFGTVAERQYPGQFIVNAAGVRFVNEAAPYTDFGHAQIAGHATGVSHIPAWMIVDDTAWKRNIICGHLPRRRMPRGWLESGLVARAQTLEELATTIGVPADALVRTAERYNDFARSGTDGDFHRGESAYDNWYGDPTYRNPNLAEVRRPPFYAFQVFPGDLGTNGGLLTDANARVLRPDKTVIEGLYACGNASATIMGSAYAGPGATIGPAMAFGYIAALHAASIGAPVQPERTS